MFKYLTPRLLIYLILCLATLFFALYWHSQSLKADMYPIEKASRDWSDIAMHPPLVIATSYNIGEHQENDKELDYLYRLAKFITQRTGVEVRILIESNLYNLLAPLERGEIDLLAGRLIRSNAIDTLRFSWIRSQGHPPLYLVQRRDSDTYISNQLGLVAKTIALPESSPYIYFIKHLSEELGGEIRIREYAGLSADSIIKFIGEKKEDYTVIVATKDKIKELRKKDMEVDIPITFNLRKGWLLRQQASDLRDSLEYWFEIAK